MRAALSVLSAVLLVGGLAACGSSDTVAAPVTSPASPQPRSGQALFASMTAAMAEVETARVTFSSSIGQRQVTGTGAFRFGDARSAADLTVTVPGQGRVRVVLLPKAFYLKLPASAGVPTTRPWLRVADGARADAFSKAFGPLVDQLRQSFDPESNLGVLKATTSIRASGREVVGGVKTTKYTATVDLAKAEQVAKGSLEAQYKTLVQSGVKTMTYSLWVDGDQLPRKFTAAVTTPQGDLTASGTYSDWGKPVSIQAPLASQLTSSDALAGATSS